MPNKVLLLSSYLTRKRSPVTHRRVPRDECSLIDNWYAGIARLGLDAVVIHDQLSPEFCARYPRCRFQWVSSPPSDWSNNDWRFVEYKSYLHSNSQTLMGYDGAFCVDMFDVRINRDPGTLLDEFDHDLFIGTDHRTPTITPETKDGRWILDRLLKAYGHNPVVLDSLKGQNYYLPGHFGGRMSVFKVLLTRYAHEIEQVVRATAHRPPSANTPPINCNMAVFQRVMNQQLNDTWRVWAEGAPMHSKLCKDDHEADVCFVHK